MEPSSFWAKLMEYGLAGIVITILFFFLWRMLIWVMKWVDEINKQHTAEREIWMKRLESLDQSIQTHNLTSIEARKATEEAHHHQREEHKEMVVILGRINGYKQ